MNHAPSGTVVGFDPGRVESWLSTTVGVRPPIQWIRLPGGHSNLTYLLVDQSQRELVIRRPPIGTLLPKAHDMWREYRIIDALWRTAVPVPEPIAYCDDRAVADSHFYVMAKAAGEALYTGAAVQQWLRPRARKRAGTSFVDALAALHSINPDAAGLADLGLHDSYVSRQLATWFGSWTAQADKAGHDDSRIHELHELLATRVPRQSSTRIVHGDYGPHNVLFDSTGDVQAILDWEVATLGDPLADFAYAINAWTEPGEAGAYGTDAPTALPGFPSREALIDRYAVRTGADLTDLGYYRAFNSWKLACILHGVYARYKSGQKSREGVDVDAVFNSMNRAVDAAMHHLSDPS